MNVTTVNRTIISCGLAFFPVVHTENISPDLRAVFRIRIAFNALICPLIILLNILVMAAVKTKRQLRTKSNIALACLSTTDLVVGLLLQPGIANHTRKFSSHWSKKHILQSKQTISDSYREMFDGIVYSFNSNEHRALCRC